MTVEQIVKDLVKEANTWKGYEKFDPMNDVALGEFLAYKNVQTNMSLGMLLQLGSSTAEEQRKLASITTKLNVATGSLVYMLRELHGGQRVSNLDTPYEKEELRTSIDDVFQKNGWSAEKAMVDAYLTLLLAENFAVRCVSIMQEYSPFVGARVNAVLDPASRAQTPILTEEEAARILKADDVFNITTAGFIRLIRRATHANKSVRLTTPYDIDKYRKAVDSFITQVRSA